MAFHRGRANATTCHAELYFICDLLDLPNKVEDLGGSWRQQSNNRARSSSGLSVSQYIILKPSGLPVIATTSIWLETQTSKLWLFKNSRQFANHSKGAVCSVWGTLCQKLAESMTKLFEKKPGSSSWWKTVLTIEEETISSIHGVFSLCGAAWENVNVVQATSYINFFLRPDWGQNKAFLSDGVV